MRQKTREIITATNLDQPLQQVDSIAAKSFDEMEKRTRKVKFYTYLLVNPKSPRMAWIFNRFSNLYDFHVLFIYFLVSTEMMRSELFRCNPSLSQFSEFRKSKNNTHETFSKSLRIFRCEKNGSKTIVLGKPK